MTNILQTIYKTIFWLSFIWILISAWTLTIGQSINYEFANSKICSDFYNFQFYATPISILLTLFGTIKKKDETIRKIITCVMTILFSALAFRYLISMLFVLGFGVWVTMNIAYENKQDPTRQIKEQQYDLGALGYGGWRVVETKSILGLFNKIIDADTTTLNKKEWVRVNKEGDAKWP